MVGGRAGREAGATLPPGVDAPGGGIEPPLTDSKSAVLPLDDPGKTLAPVTKVHRIHKNDTIGLAFALAGSDRLR